MLFARGYAPLAIVSFHQYPGVEVKDGRRYGLNAKFLIKGMGASHAHGATPLRILLQFLNLPG
jgi:hypothetical protein